MRKIYFVSKNREKYEEVKKILACDKIAVEFYEMDIPELQTDKEEDLIKQKAKEAFTRLKRPVIVEHTALDISAFNNLPGLQTSYFYKKMGYENIVDYCRHKRKFEALVKSVLCICNGQEYLTGIGEERGSIVKSLRGIKTKDGFDWDKIFVPRENNPKKLTYTQLGKEKNKRSMRKRAWDDLKSKHKKLSINTGIDAKMDAEMEELAGLIRQKKVMLFVGAGISASLGFPTWWDLIGRIGRQQGYEPEILGCYGDNMMLAEYLGGNKCGPLYKHVTEEFKITGEVQEKLLRSKIYEKMLGIGFPVIYTTNYDQLIEEWHKQNGVPFTKVVNIEDMEMMRPDGSTRIMKFHGDIGDKESIVLSESQYFERMSFQSFMDVQLQADMLRYNILFLGYSLSDTNIKLLLYLARKRWSDTAKAKKAYIYTATPNQIQKEVFRQNGIITFWGDETDKEKGTLDFLEQLSEKVPL